MRIILYWGPFWETTLVPPNKDDGILEFVLEPFRIIAFWGLYWGPLFGRLPGCPLIRSIAF